MNNAYFVAEAYNRALIFKPDYDELYNMLDDRFVFTGYITTKDSDGKVIITKLDPMNSTQYMDAMMGKSYKNVCSTDIRSVEYTVTNPYEVTINLDCQQYRLGEGMGEEGRGFYNIKAETKLTLTSDGKIIGIDQPVYDKFKVNTD